MRLRKSQKSKGNKLTVFYKVLNEADFLKESLQSIYAYADRIVVLEYCLESMRKIIRPDRVTEAGLSVDGTTEIIRSFPDPDKKIDYRPVGFIPGEESIPYQMIVDLAEVGEYIWVLDGDIVYPPLLAQRIREWVDSGEYDVIWIPERVFFHDFHHEQHNFFAHHQRVFKKPTAKAFYFPGCFEVHWIEEEKGVTAKGLHYYGRDSDFPLQGGILHHFPSKIADEQAHGFAYHYALVRSVQRMLEKLLWQYAMIERRWMDSPERDVCRQAGRNALEFKLKTHVWFLAHQPDLGMMVRRWAGRHPDVMYNNQWMNYRWDEKPVKISYQKALSLIGNPGVC
jgi:hypothetical protein